MGESDSELATIVEERRRSTLDLIYQTPGLGLAAQAFILTITLSPNTTATARIIAAAVGVVAGTATAQAIVKHNYTETMYGAVLDGLRDSYGAVRLHRAELRAHVTAAGKAATNDEFARWDSGWRKWAKGIPATDLWVYSLLLFALLDVVVLVLSVVDATGVWHPFSGKH